MQCAALNTLRMSRLSVEHCALQSSQVNLFSTLEMKARESICFLHCFFSNLQGDFHAIRMFKVFTFPRMNDYDDYSYSAASAATATVKATANLSEKHGRMKNRSE